MSEKSVRIGGLLRCCVQTLDEHVFSEPPKEGDVLACKWCQDTMTYRDGAWEWTGLDQALAL